jgi:hypothetical protein
MKVLSNPLLILAATLAGTQLASADTLVLSPTDDSTIRLNTVNQGGNQALIVGDTLPNPPTNSELIRTALAFDLSNPALAGATINSVTLTLSVRTVDGTSVNAPVTIDLHQLASSFTNLGVTWTSRDGTNNWTTPGGDISGVLASLSANPRTVTLAQSLVFSGASLTSAAQSAAGGSFYLLAKLAVEDTADRNVFQFASNDNTTATPKPVLTIDYTPAADSTPPAIVPPTVPADDATSVLVSTSLTATFSELIALESGGTITIDDLGAGPDTVITLPDARINVVDGTNLVITPASPLATSTDYAIQISSNAVKDLAPTPNFFAGISDTTAWSFQTAADGTAPGLLLPTIPADGDTGVAPGTNLVVNFDESVVAGSGNIRVRNLSRPSKSEVIPVGDPRVTFSGTGTTLTIDPANDLGWADDYAIRIDAGAIKDTTGNSFPGILDDFTWNFTVAGAKVLAASDDRCETTPPYDVLDNTRTTDLAVGPISSGRYFRSYLTFDLTGASAATGETTLVLSQIGVENNTSSVPQTFTLFVLDSDWNGASFPGPEGTAVATVNLTPATGNDNRGISFTSAALTTAFNSAIGGNLHLGIKSDVEGPDSRSFLFLASLEDVGLEPRLNYTVASGGDTFASWISGKPGVGSQTAVGDDPDGDGNDNGVENFFGTGPGVFSEGLVVSAVDTGAGTFTFTHPQGSLASDLTAGYRWSTDLATFHNDGATSGGTTVNFSTVPDPVVAGTPTTVTATVTGTPVRNLFVRVEVTQN